MGNEPSEVGGSAHSCVTLLSQSLSRPTREDYHERAASRRRSRQCLRPGHDRSGAMRRAGRGRILGEVAGHGREREADRSRRQRDRAHRAGRPRVGLPEESQGLVVHLGPPGDRARRGAHLEGRSDPVRDGRRPGVARLEDHAVLALDRVAGCRRPCRGHRRGPDSRRRARGLRHSRRGGLLAGPALLGVEGLDRPGCSARGSGSPWSR